jgi:hypothetical protein
MPLLIAAKVAVHNQRLPLPLVVAIIDFLYKLKRKKIEIIFLILLKILSNRKHFKLKQIKPMTFIITFFFLW